MLYASSLSSFPWFYDNWGANPSATPGTSVVPGASNAEGSWTQIASAANIAKDCYGLHIVVSGAASAAAAKPQIMDIGADPAGGTSYTAEISNIAIGCSPLLTQGGAREFFFPYFIKAGSAVAVRIQGTNATAGTVRVAARFYGQPSNPEAMPVGRFSETIGTITGSNGVSFTPGNAADGSWTLLGTTAKRMWWWQLGYQIDNGTITAEYTYIDLAYGDASNKIVISRTMHIGTTGESCGLIGQANLAYSSCYADVPGGTNIYVRGRCLNAPDSGYNAVAIGIGG